MSSLNTALDDVTNTHDNKENDASNLARAKGWVAPESYDYDKYTATPAPAEQPAGDAGDGQLPEWAANAAKYEWKDEYGDVGPEIPELEEQLFRNEFINRAGLKIGKYVSCSLKSPIANR